MWGRAKHGSFYCCYFFSICCDTNKLTTANHVYLPTTSLMALVTTPFSTRVRLTAWGRGKQQTSQVIEQPAFLIWYAKWMDAFVPSLLPSVASFQSSCSDFFRTENTRMTISGVNTARHCRIQTQKKREKSFNNEGPWAFIERTFFSSFNCKAPCQWWFRKITYKSKSGHLWSVHKII